MNYNALAPTLRERMAHARFPVVKLGSLTTTLQYGSSKLATTEPVGTPIIRMANLQADGWRFEDLKYVELTPEELDMFRLNHGDILFNRTNSKELVGKCEVFDEPGEWVFASYMMRLAIDTTRARPAFVSAYLGGPTGRAQIERDSRQIIGMTNINAEEIRALDIALPPRLEEQDALLADLDAARAARDAGLKAADDLLAGIDEFVLDALGLVLPLPPDPTRSFAVRFVDLKEDRIDADYFMPRFKALRQQIESSAFNVHDLRDLCLPLRSGFAAGADDQSEGADGIPHIRPTNILRTGEIADAGMKFVPRSSVGPGDLIQPGEVLFNNTNSSTWVGKSAVFDRDDECACSNHITRIQLRDHQNSSIFLASLFNAMRSLGYFSVLATNFNNQAGINADVLGALRIPMPPPDQQSEIAAEVDRRRIDARWLREDARATWEAARARFEYALLGPAA